MLNQFTIHDAFKVTLANVEALVTEGKIGEAEVMYLRAEIRQYWRAEQANDWTCANAIQKDIERFLSNGYMVRSPQRVARVI